MAAKPADGETIPFREHLSVAVQQESIHNRPAGRGASEDPKIPPPDPDPDPEPDHPPGPNPDEPGPDVINPEGDPLTNPPPYRLGA